MTETRQPTVAGQFYGGTADVLKDQIASAFEHPVGPGSIPNVGSGEKLPTGIVSPHAGYPFSGPFAAHGFARLVNGGRPEAVIIIGPNHTRHGVPIAISGAGKWKTPLRISPVHDELRAEMRTVDGVVVDEPTHDGEHSIEVQVPFLQYFYEDPVPILPIVMSQQDERNVSRLESALQKAFEIEPRSVLIASTDLTHYEPPKRASQEDAVIREAIESLDADAILQAARTGHTMCGAGPTAAVMRVAKHVGIESGRVLAYGTSGDTAGDTDSVVGYVSASFE